MNKKARPSIVRLGLHLLCPTTKLAHAPPFPGKVGAGGKWLINSLYLQSKISNQQSLTGFGIGRYIPHLAFLSKAGLFYIFSTYETARFLIGNRIVS
jgi:hypothetical protein